MTGPEFLQAADAQVAHNNRLCDRGRHSKINADASARAAEKSQAYQKRPGAARIPDAQETRERHRQPEAEAEKWDPSFLKSYAQLEAERRALA